MAIGKDISEQIEWIKGQLWDIAVECYGLEESEETAYRLSEAAARLLLSHSASSNTLHHGNEISVASELIDDNLALAFMVVALAKHDLNDIQMFVLAAEALGQIKVLGQLRRQGIDAAPLCTFKGSIASYLAKLRHVENRGQTQRIIDYWKDNIDPSISAEKAAELIEIDAISTFSHKKIAEIVSSEKNRLGIKPARGGRPRKQ